MKAIVTIIVPIVCTTLIMLVIGFATGYSPSPLRYEYSTRISVDTADKIENAVSNAVSDLDKRYFVLVNMEVKWHPASQTYVIYARGIDRTKLGKYEP